jgi:phospholipase C
MFIVYDEWGGFFDHVRPPRVPDDRASSDLNEDFGQMGFRIPAVAISPYARNVNCGRARVSHTKLGFESILSLISYRFGLGNLVTRDQMANNIGESFDWDPPTLEPPELPDPTAIASVPCALGGDTGALSDDLTAAHTSDLDALEDLADHFGFPVGSGKADEIFREPDSIEKAAAEGDALACEGGGSAEPPPPAGDRSGIDAPPAGDGGIVPATTPPRRRRRKKRRKKRRKHARR